MLCNGCGLEFNESDLRQVVAHEHQNENILDKKIDGRLVTHNVVSIFFKNDIKFSGLDWECAEYIENNFGNGFNALMHIIVKI